MQKTSYFNYTKPIEKNHALFQLNTANIDKLYQQLRVEIKRIYPETQYAFLTGHFAYNRVNIFSDLDISIDMITASNRALDKFHPSLKELVKFTTGDGQGLPFKDNTFDLVMSGGSTAFIDNIPETIKEYARVTKPWGFIGDINFYYHTLPPRRLLDEMNALMGIDIQAWEREYWEDIYTQTGLEMYHISTGQMEYKGKGKVSEYCHALVDKHNDWSEEVKEAAYTRLEGIMNLFDENHKYLAYGVFIMRKDIINEPILF